MVKNDQNCDGNLGNNNDLSRKTSEEIDYGSFSLGYDYVYFANDLKKTFTGPDGETIEYSYDENNRTAGITIPGQGQITYNTYQWNSPTRVTLPGGSTTDYTYDPLMRLKTITAKDPGQNPVVTRNYTYSQVGNITEKATEHGNYTYQYDNLYRLTEAVNPTIADEEYTYDPIGNRLTSASTTGNWSYNTNNELTGYDDVSYVYDDNGNTTKKTTGTDDVNYIYDTEDRLTEVRDGSDNLVASYYYDPFGRRLWKDVDGTKTYFLYSDEGLIGEYDSTGTEIKTYGWAPGSQWSTDPLFQKAAGIYYWYQNDHLGTPQKITTTSGAIAWSAVYDSFGNCQIGTENITNNLRFSGQYFDAETGLYYNLNRYYDPTIGRYLRIDPFGRGLNLYTYCFNNPHSWIDPLGLCAAKKAWNWWSDLVTIDLDKVSDYLGTESGDIFTIGGSVAWWGVGIGFSFDRVVMPSGEADWFITGGGGLSTPGFSIGFDRGKAWKLDLIKNTDDRFYLSSQNISKKDIEGFSLSSNADIAKKFGIGGEVIINPFSSSEIYGLEYPAPLIILKGGPRVALSPGVNLFGNWTFDIGD